MSELTFDTFEQRLFELYNAKEYSQAFELVEREKASFPGYIREIAYWRLCMHALLGKSAEALRIFREVLDRGDWFPPKWLKEDPDLVSLQQLPCELEIRPGLDHSYPPDFAEYVLKGLAFVEQE